MPEIGKLWDGDQARQIMAMDRIVDELDDPDELYVVDRGDQWEAVIVDVDLHDGGVGHAKRGEFLVCWIDLEEAEQYRDHAAKGCPIATVDYDDCTMVAREEGMDGIVMMLHFVPHKLRWVR